MLRSWIEQKDKGRANSLSPCLNWDIYILFCPWTFVFLVLSFHTQNRTYTISPLILRLNWLLAFLILLLPEGRLWVLLVSITALPNSYNKSPLIYLYISPIIISPLWRTLINTITKWRTLGREKRHIWETFATTNSILTKKEHRLNERMRQEWSQMTN